MNADQKKAKQDQTACCLLILIRAYSGKSAAKVSFLFRRHSQVVQNERVDVRRSLNRLLGVAGSVT